MTLNALPAVIWNGGGGSNTSWSDGANWVNGAAPQGGNNVIFPPLSTAQNPSFDISNTIFGLVGISGSNYTLTGGVLPLTGLISTGSGNVVSMTALDPNGANPEIANDTNNTLVINSQLRLVGHSMAISGATGETDLKGIISGDGGLIISTSGRVVISASNAYGGTTQILSGTLAVSNAQALGLGGATTLASGASLVIDGPLDIFNESLTVVPSSNPSYDDSEADFYADNSSSSGVSDWEGDINVNDYEFNLESDTGALRVDGNITSASSYISTAGKVILSGTDSLYYIDSSGSLEVDGTVSTSYYFYNSGTLSGTGTIDTTTSNPLYLAGTLAPGNASGVGTLQANNAYFDSSNTFNVQISSSGYGELGLSSSTVLLAGSLTVTLLDNYVPAPGSTFEIIDNTGGNPISGIFSNLPEGSILTAGSTDFEITYKGGGSNDVMLKVVAVSVWNGGAGSSDTGWENEANWVGGSKPQAGANLIFPALNGTTAKTSTNNFPTDTNFGSITISGSGYTLSGSDVTLASGISSSGSGNTVKLNLVLTADQQIVNSANSKFIVSGTIDLGSNTLTIADSNSGYSGETDLNGIISGNGGLIISGYGSGSYQGRVVLAGTNTYKGTTNVLSGYLALKNDSALGAGGDSLASGTTLENNARLELDGPLTISDELLTLPSSSSYNYGYLSSYSTSQTGVNYWTGDINIAGSTGQTYFYPIAESGSLEIDGTITGGSNAYLVPDYGPLTFTGAGSGVGNFYNDDQDGAVVVDGSFNATNEFYVESDATTEIDGKLTTPYGVINGTLSGTGTVTAPSGVINVYGQVAPGTASGPGALTVGNLDFQSGSSLDAQLAGASSYSVLQVAVGDTLTLSGGIVSVSLLNGFTPSEGQQFHVVSSGGGTISGTFSGLPDGSRRAGRQRGVHR